MKNKLFLIFVALLFLVSACGNNETQNQTYNDQETNGEDSLIRVKNTVTEDVDTVKGQEIAKHLVEIASKTPNVNDATAVVIGKFAVVGIDVNSELDRSRVGTIKYTVAEALKKDPHGANAIVIADPDTNIRLKEMYTDIEKGHPIEGIMDELAGIVGRLMPQIPSDIEEGEDALDQNMNQVQGENEKQLKQIQNEQSNLKGENQPQNMNNE